MLFYTGCTFSLFFLMSSVLMIEGIDENGNEHENSRVKRKANCHARFQLDKTRVHAACFPGPMRRLLYSEKELILTMHNQFRSKPIPVASDMQKLMWNEELEIIAQKWAEACKMDYDTWPHVPGRYEVGQNIAIGYLSWEGAINSWYNQKQYFEYGGYVSERTTGHYTQLMWANTSLIGCGYNLCLARGFYVCNYAPKGNDPYSLSFPYQTGGPCQKCPYKCWDKLCDCELTCLNFGYLDPSTCSCTCINHDSYESQQCSLKCSIDMDPPLCKDKTPPCDSGTSVICPTRCRLCPYALDSYDADVLPSSKTTTQTYSRSLTVSLIILVQTWF